MKKILTAVLLTVLALALLSACMPAPDNSQIEAAIRQTLSRETAAPEMDFASMTVPTRASGKAMAVLNSVDETIVRGYIISYDSKAGSFVAVLDYTRKLDLVPVKYYEQPSSAKYYNFDFSAAGEAEYMLIYIGEGDTLQALRSAYEGSNEDNSFPAAVYAQFEVCDLGGDTLVLLVPRYQGLKVWINRIEYNADAAISGDEVARFESGMPIYIYCGFYDKMPDYEIHVSFDDGGHFFTTNEGLLKSIK